MVTVAAPRSQRRSAIRATLARPQFWFGLCTLGPILLWYAIFPFWSIVVAVFISLVNYQVLEPFKSRFVGLKNFTDLGSNPLFWTSLVQTFLYAAELFVILLPLALLVACCLVKVVRGRSVYQFVVFLPVVVSLVAISLLFKTLMDPQIGLFDQLLRMARLPESKFLASSNSALISVVSVDVWKSLGFYVVILTAGLLGIPQHIYESAMLDGAGAVHRFRHITLPLLGHTLTLVSILIVFQGLQVFTQVMVLPPGPGGPGRSTYVMNLFIYDQAFSQLRFGYATAAAFVLFVIVFVLTMIQLRLIRPSWSY
jgi:multiple sugar transport system permease protein